MTQVKEFLWDELPFKKGGSARLKIVILFYIHVGQVPIVKQNIKSYHVFLGFIPEKYWSTKTGAFLTPLRTFKVRCVPPLLNIWIPACWTAMGCWLCPSPLAISHYFACRYARKRSIDVFLIYLFSSSAFISLSCLFGYENIFTTKIVRIPLRSIRHLLKHVNARKISENWLYKTE